MTMRWIENFTDSVDMNLSKLWDTVKDRGAWQATVHVARVGHNLAIKPTTTMQKIKTAICDLDLRERAPNETDSD